MKRELPSNKDELVEVSNVITVREAGRRGGHATRTRFQGTDFYRRIGAMGGKRQKELYHDLLAEFGRMGGRPRRPSLEDSMGGESPEKKEADAVGPGDPSPA